VPASRDPAGIERVARSRGLDPRTKLVVLLVTNVVLLAYGDAGSFSWSRVGFAALVGGLLLAGRQYAFLGIFVVSYGLAAAADALLLPATTGTAAFALAACTGLVLRVLPGLAAAVYLVRTTTVSEYVAAMQRARAPKMLTIPVAVMLRFFPTIVEEYAQVGDAMRLRGLSGTGWRHPVRALEWRFVPLLVALTRSGDDLTAAALSRGLDAPTPRTSLRQVRFGRIDLAVTATVLALAAWHLLGNDG
jgi:energy-coupling factor transport system permease protein